MYSTQFNAHLDKKDCPETGLLTIAYTTLCVGGW
jgi:hypothetical protein